MTIFGKRTAFVLGFLALTLVMTALSFSARSLSAREADRNRWNPQWRVGMFLHFLPGGDFHFHSLRYPELPPYESFFYLPDWHLRDRLIEHFDVEGIAD